MPAKAVAPSTSRKTTAAGLPNTRTPKSSRAQTTSSTISGITNSIRPAIMPARNCQCASGVAKNRLSSLRIRISTTANPTPHRPPPMSESAISPGTRKSM